MFVLHSLGLARKAPSGFNNHTRRGQIFFSIWSAQKPKLCEFERRFGRSNCAGMP